MSQLHPIPTVQSDIFQNRILARLPDEEREQILTRLEPVDLPRGYLIASLGGRVEHVYFLEQGIGSVIAVSPEGHKAEAGMFGNEAFSPAPAVAGSLTSSHDVVMQVDGFGHRLTASDFKSLIQACPVFRDLLVKSIYNMGTQLSYTALSNAIHQVDERLARWLLMCHDRIEGDQLVLTHDYISLMLAVRRPSVTTSLHVLEGNLFIKSERKLVTIRNREAMEEFAHDAYGRPEQELRELFGMN